MNLVLNTNLLFPAQNVETVKGFTFILNCKNNVYIFSANHLIRNTQVSVLSQSRSTFQLNIRLNITGAH